MNLSIVVIAKNFYNMIFVSFSQGILDTPFFNLLFLISSFVLYRDNIKTDLNQMNDNLNETNIQNALLLVAYTVQPIKFLNLIFCFMKKRSSHDFITRTLVSTHIRGILLIVGKILHSRLDYRLLVC
jgi:hypothetical protein